eukprot:11892985-Heterocapsa_arctica.AAC.1
MGDRRVLLLSPRYVAAETRGKEKLCQAMEPETMERGAAGGRQAVASFTKRVDAACQEPDASMASAAPWSPAVMASNGRP